MAHIFASGVGFKASTVSVSQDIMMRMAALSKGNVRIQMLVMPHMADPSGAAYNARFVCEKCGATNAMAMEIFTKEDELLIATEWCKQHAHEVKPLTVEERVIRSADERKLKVVL